MKCILMGMYQEERQNKIRQKKGKKKYKASLKRVTD